MAAGSLTVFEEAMGYIQDGGWEPTDEIWIGLTTSTPTAADAVPAFISGGTTNYTQVTPGGNYATGGLLLDTFGDLVTEAAGVMKFDTSGTSDNEAPSWASHASNPTDARWAIIYNTTDTANRAIAYIDLGAAINMTLGALTITFNASGIYTITKAA